jgi:hypothetical protein
MTMYATSVYPSSHTLMARSAGCRRRRGWSVHRITHPKFPLTFESEYLAFFASKTVEMIRAPDSYVYPAPGNIIETLLVAPFEYASLRVQSLKANTDSLQARAQPECICQGQLTIACAGLMGSSWMTTAEPGRNVGCLLHPTRRSLLLWYDHLLYILPLSLGHRVESVFRSNKNSWLKAWFHSEDEGDDDTPENRNPHVSEPQGLQIVKTKFEDLTRAFPDTTLSSEATLKQEIRGLREQLDMVLRRLDQMSGEQDDKGRKGRKKSRSSSSRAAS